MAQRRQRRPGVRRAAPLSQEPKLLQVLEWRDGPDGPASVPVYTVDRIVQWLRSGGTPLEAAASVGVGKSTYYQWLGQAAAVEVKVARMESGAQPKRRLSQREQVLLSFKRECVQAIAQHAVRLAALGTRLASGEGIVTETITEKITVNTAGVQVGDVERTTKTTAALPDPTMVRFMLKSRHGWVEREVVEHQGEGGLPSPPSSGNDVTVHAVASVLDALATKIADRRAQLAEGSPARQTIDAIAGVIPTTAVEAVPPTG